MSEGIMLAAGKWYVIYHKPHGICIKCLHCGTISFNWNDITKKYCGNCHAFLEE